MLNYLWGYMILIGIGFGILTGEVEALSNAAIDSTGEAVTMAITMLGIMSMWTGLIEIAKRSGLLDQITRKLDPVLHFLFPRIPKDHIAKEYISANIVANLLGLGWAATPMGLKAMKEQLDEELKAVEREIIGYLDSNEKLSETGNDFTVKISTCERRTVDAKRLEADLGSLAEYQRVSQYRRLYVK